MDKSADEVLTVRVSIRYVSPVMGLTIIPLAEQHLESVDDYIACDNPRRASRRALSFSTNSEDNASA